MLTNEQLEILGDDFVRIFQNLEQETVKDIARRLLKTKRWTETAELQAEALQALGYSPEHIKYQVLQMIEADPDFIKTVEMNTLEYKKTVEKLVTKAVDEAKAKGDVLVSKAGDMGFRNDMRLWKQAGKKLDLDSPLVQTITFYKKQLSKSIDNLTRTTGFVFPGEGITPLKDAYREELNKAMVKVSSGAFTSEQVISQATKRLAQSGVRTVHYASGKSRNLDTAMRLSLQTTLAQLAANITMDNAIEMGEDLVEVSSHAGARNTGIGCMNHASWQGKVYSISGKVHPEESERLGYKIKGLTEATGYPDDPAGLCGYNCRHTFNVFFEGISEPIPPKKEPEAIKWHGKKYDYFQATQKQRQLEREIRQTKREIACGVEGRMGYLTNKEAQYVTFCHYAGLKININRLEVANTRSSLYLLNKSNEIIYNKYVEVIGNQMPSLDKFTKMKYNETSKYLIMKDYYIRVHEGELSPLVGLSFFEDYHKKLQDKLIGMRFKNGIEIKTVSYHFTARAIGTHDWVAKDVPRKTKKEKFNHVHIPDDILIECIEKANGVSTPNDIMKFDLYGKCCITINKKKGKLVQCNAFRKGKKKCTD